MYNVTGLCDDVIRLIFGQIVIIVLTEIAIFVVKKLILSRCLFWMKLMKCYPEASRIRYMMFFKSYHPVYR